MRVQIEAWSPKAGHKTFTLNAPDLKTAVNVARARVGPGEIRATPYRKEQA